MAISSKTRSLAITGMLGAILVIMAFTPLGFIPIGPAKYTTMFLPVIVGAILEGPIVGLGLGLLFGLLSLLSAFTAPSLLSPIFISDWFFVTILPRLLIGPVVHYSFSGLDRLFKHSFKALPISAGIAAALGALTNTVGVLGFMFLRNGPQAAELWNVSVEAVGGLIFGIATANGIPEAILAVAICTPVVMAIRHLRRPKAKASPK